MRRRSDEKEECEMVDYIRSEGNKRAGLPFSDAVRVGDVLYLSGQMGVAPGTKTLVPGGVTAQARQAMDNIGRALEKNGLTFDAVFKATVMLAASGRRETSGRGCPSATR